MASNAKKPENMVKSPIAPIIKETLPLLFEFFLFAISLACCSVTFLLSLPFIICLDNLFEKT